MQINPMWKCLASKSIFLAILTVHITLQTATSWSTGFGGNPQRTSQVIPTDTFPSSTISRPYEVWKKRTVGQITSSAVLNIEDSIDPLAYITDDVGNIICFQLTSGIFSWVVSTSYTINSSPLVFEDMLYVTTSERLYAIDKIQGARKYTIEARVESSPVISVDGKVLIFGDLDGRVYGCNAENGKIIWTYKAGAAVRSSPAISGDDKTVVFGCDDKYVYALEVTTGTFKWKTGTRSIVRSSPALSTTHVYIGAGFGDGRLYCLRMSDGSIVWEYQTGNGISSSPSISSDGSTVFVGSSDNNIYAIDAFSSVLKWKVETGADVASSPTLSTDGSLVYQGSNDGFMYAIKVKTGEIVWKYDVKDPVTGSVALSRGGEIMFFGAGKNIFSVGSGRFNQYGELKQDGSLHVDL